MKTPFGPVSAELALEKKLQARVSEGLFRETHPFPDPEGQDFISNDYLSLGRETVFQDPILLETIRFIQGGSGASRLVCGESPEVAALEEDGARFFGTDSTLFFPSGYLANQGLLSTVAGRGDTYIYDAHCHMSIKEGMRLSLANRFSFRHQDMDDLVKKLKKAKGNVFVVAEAIYSMEGDICPLSDLTEVCTRFGAHLILDEAHSTGVSGLGGRGLGYGPEFETKIFARILTFGKALGAAGALVGCSTRTRTYLINYCPSFIYSTGPSPIQTALCQYQLHRLKAHPEWPAALQKSIQTWVNASGEGFSKNLNSPVQYILAGETQKAIHWMKGLERFGFLTKAMVSPTVPSTRERLRISLHRHNSERSILQLIQCFSENRNFF
jgi:8-amino-7-oxononanoate synthase